MKWQDFVDITPEQFMKMGKQELKEVTQILASVGNKRLKRAQEKGFTSPSIEAVLTKGKFSTKDKSYNELRNEFIRARNFLQSKTGTLSEYNKFKRKSLKSMNEQTGIKISSDQFEKFWRAHEELKKNNPEIANKGLKYAVLQELESKINDDESINVAELVESLQNNLEEIYEANQERAIQAEENSVDLGSWDYNPFEDENRVRKSYEAYRKKARKK